ncbi:MAG: hypothetical protein Unbinned1327contig1000_25 [Prokaryotic dsDNA virus sp.]|nr:MAG: hypothetical protein Unbinned1327contig1000_25 [Prokaryotic dsDNA virus sp.]|tara:strand:- start:29211 stop:29546 length:336 start_codon:yes stop_codon:yes gene_type:complete
MCDNPFSSSGNTILDDFFGMNPQRPAPSGPAPVAPRQIMRAQTLTGGNAKSAQRKVMIKALEDRKKRGDKSAGKSMLAIGRAKGFGSQPFIGGVSMAAGPSAAPMTGINYG